MRLFFHLLAVCVLLVPACSDAGPSAGDQGLDAAGGSDADAADTGLPDEGTEDVGPLDLGLTEQDCLDGLDDDMDGDPDCADPDCNAVVMCVPAADVGWSIPGLLEAGATTGACSGVFDTEAYLGNASPTGDPASCSACACSSPMFTGCVLEPAVCQKSGGCAGTCNAGRVMGTGCIESPEASTNIIPRDGLALGTCSVTAAVATTTPPSWGREGRVCTSAGAAVGCQTTNVCVPRPATSSPMCVVATGDVACPTGYEGSREVFFDELDDSRGCSTCQCSFDAGNCIADITAYSAASCGGTATALVIGACVAGDPASYRIENVRASATATCGVSSGGAPIGAVAGAMPSTVCCAPTL